jgi:hypothetical protein
VTYVRKTRDVYDIQQYTGKQYGWETVLTVELVWAARQHKREYAENQPEFPVRIVKRRVKLVQGEPK